MSKKSYKSSSKDGGSYEEYKSFNLKDKYQSSDDKLISEQSEIGKSENKEDVESKQVEEKKNNETGLNEDPNELGAKLIKAELFGDEDLVKSLKQRLEVARQNAEAKKPDKNKSDYRESNEYRGNKKQHHHHSQHRKHQKQRDEEAEEIMANKRYKALKSDDEDFIIEAKKQKTDHKKTKSADAQKIQKQKADLNSGENCELCFENVKKHLVISVGKHCYLCVPSNQSFVDGHCLIVPISHCESSLNCDEEVWSEIQEFRQALVKMFDSRRYDCVFYEQNSAQNRFSHMVVECVPLPINVSNMAPIYFKKAIMESESEWADNKSIIDLSKQDIRKSIPKHMPYFTVGFGLDDGYAHVIENSDAFPEYFAKEIIGGILDLDPLEWRRPRKDDFSAQSKKVIEFLKWWKPFEFNKKQ